VEHAQAVAAGVEDVAFIQDHLDGEVRRGFAESATQDGEVIAIGDLVRGQTVRGNDPTAGETRDGGDVVEMLMGENDRVDLCRCMSSEVRHAARASKPALRPASIRRILSRPLKRYELHDRDRERSCQTSSSMGTAVHGAPVRMRSLSLAVGLATSGSSPLLRSQRLSVCITSTAKPKCLADEIEKASLVHGDDAGVGLERNGRSRTWRRADDGDLAKDLARADPMQLLLRAVDLLRQADETGDDDEEFIALAALGEDAIAALIGRDLIVRVDAPFRAQARRCHIDRPPGSLSDPRKSMFRAGSV